MGNHTIIYAALCVIAPVAWGLVVYRIPSAIESRLKPVKPKVNRPEGKSENQKALPLEYHI